MNFWRKRSSSSLVHSERVTIAMRTNLAQIVATMIAIAVATPSWLFAKPAPVSARTPIKHLIVIVGENRTFDHLFGTYRPRDGQTGLNLLSNTILHSDGVLAGRVLL